MNAAPLPFSRDLVLVGGGHTHALVLRAWGMRPLPGVRLTLIDPGPATAYSGMLPGHVAGHYDRAALDIDLVRLARFAGARIILGRAEAIDRPAGRIHVAGRPPVGYDVASLDIGITSDMPDLPGFADHAVPAKPLGPFADRWAAYLEGGGAADVALVGAGVAGAELSLAMAHALAQRGRPARISLIEAGTALSALGARARGRMRRALAEAGVRVIENATITAITARGVTLADCTEVPAGFVTGAAGARPYPWLEETGLTLRHGFVAVNARLESSDAAIFAAGDCAHLNHAPRPKAGVFAVREAPVLDANLRAALGHAPYRRYRPQRDYLKLVSLGERSALVERFGLALSGRWLWRLKDRIDRRFMQRLAELPAMPAPDLPFPRARGLRAALGPNPLCGGCGAKVGADVLARGLGTHGGADRKDVARLPGDDAALLGEGTARQVFSTDHLRGMTLDPMLMARIAVHHAMGDVLAMGAAPQAATLSLIMPRQSPVLAERMLAEIMAAVDAELAGLGAALAGGHTSLGDELTVGLAVTGLLDRAPITLAGARPGDALILTKPLGSGTILAAEMAHRAPGAVVATCWASMVAPQAAAARVLAAARAMTDVTGFGLAGHLRNMMDASGCGAALELDRIPVMPGATALARAGIRSSLYPQNRAAAPDLPDDAAHALLFDPQTAGGLLAAVASDRACEVLAALRGEGYPAARIGTVTDRPGVLQVVASGSAAAMREAADARPS